MVKTYYKASINLHKRLRPPHPKLHHLGEIQLKDYLFTADAVVMHPKIGIEEDIAAILLSFEPNIVKYDTEKTPTPQLIRALRLMVKHL